MKTLLHDCIAQLAADVDRFPWERREAYAEWLAQTYYYVCHSTRLLAAAAARFPMDERGNALHHRFAAHMAEEKKHELLLIHDLKRIGASIVELPESSATRMFYEPQYYKIEHICPIALFGYILPLEAIGPRLGRAIIARVVKAHGDRSASFLEVHSDEDVEHLEKALRMVESVSPAERAAVENNLRQTTDAYSGMLLDIRGRVEARTKAA